MISKRAFNIALAAASTALFTPQTSAENKKQNFLLNRTLPLHKLLPVPSVAECWASDELKKNMKDKHTNCYVWGEGYQVDASQEFSNFTPKKIRNFEGPQKADIVDIALGWYHEAYIDKEGKLYVC